MLVIPRHVDLYAFYKRTLIIPLAVILIVYAWYFVTRAEAIDQEFRDVDVFARRRIWLSFVAYTCVTVVGFIASVAWRWGARRALPT
jgi:SNF family Na+-dependent transporter